MQEKLRKSGIDILGEVPWGTYFCQFHNSSEELLEIIAPYFKAGLENNEFCVWIISPPLTMEEAISSMKRAVPDFNQYLEKGQIELISYFDWYLKDGVFDRDRILGSWGEKLTAGLSKGYEGMRVTGDTSWVDKKDWTAFMEYEDGHSSEYPMIANCTYSLKRCTTPEVITVTAKHQFALVKTDGGWQLVESSEHRRAEDMRRKNERLLQDIIDGSPSMIFIKDLDGRFITVNKQMEKLVGIPLQNLKGKTDFDIVSKDRAEHYREHDRQVREAGKAIQFEEIDDSSDEKRIFLANKFPLFDAAGRMYGTCSISHDITDRKRGEEELRKEKIYLEKLHNSLGDVVLVVKFPERTIEFANAAVEAVFGYEINDCVGRRTDFLHANAEGYADFGKKMGNVLRDGMDVLQTEHLLRRKNGEIFPSGITTSFLKTNGVITSVISVIRDISDQKKAEEIRIASHNRISREMLDAIPGIVYVIDEQAQLVRWNKKLEIITGRSEEEIRTIRPIDMLHEDYKELGANKIREGFTAGKAEMEADLISKEGQRIPHYFSARRFEAEGKTYLVGMCVDITERKKIETELQRTAKLESAGILAGGIAHDFNNLLTGIVGNLSLAKELTGSPDRLLKILANTEKASLRATGLTRQLLTFAKGGLPVKETTHIANLVKDAVNFALSGSNVKCEFSIPKDLCLVDIDKEQVSQVISNITINACQAMPSGGVISIECQNVQIDRWPIQEIEAGRFLKITVRDNGIGIPEEHIKKIFDPYFTTKQTGSGLGLAISYSIIRKHGGNIVVESELGVGSTFHVYLPASQARAQINAGPEEIQNLITPCGKILVMDDEEIVRETVGMILKHKGHEVDSAKDGSEAIELYQQAKLSNKPYDVLIMDLTIPGGMGGKETIKKLLEIDPDVKAIVSSGYSNDPIMSDFKRYGFINVIAKPYKASELIEKISKVLNCAENQMI